MSSVLGSLIRKTPPVVVVLGATGAGKSKLALELAQHFGGEIISADAMQMYKGLDIVTNKVTDEERKAVPHHVIDFLEPTVTECTVVDFRNMALPVVTDLLQRGVLPFICGGTNYYVESLLWDVLIDEGRSFSKRSHDTREHQDGGEGQPEMDERHKGTSNPNGDDGSVSELPAVPDVGFDDSISNEDLHRLLTEVDPERAAELHPNERRKLIRSLQVVSRSGVRHSALISAQRSAIGGSGYGGPLRFGVDDCFVIWVQSDQEVLDRRCDKRVDVMIQRGMIAELEQFQEDYNRNRDSPADYTVGIFQSIGFKEFHDYLLLDAEARQTEKGKKLFEEGVEQLKAVTRRYARRQLKWLRQRFLNSSRESPPVFAVDSTDPSRWDEIVLQPAIAVVQAFLTGTEPPFPPMPKTESAYSLEEIRRVYRCEVCDRSFKGALQMEAHLTSNKHSAQAKSKARSDLTDWYTVIVTGKESGEMKDALACLKRLSKDKGLAELKESLQKLDQDASSFFDLPLRLRFEEAKSAVSKLANVGVLAEWRKLEGKNIRQNSGPVNS